MHVFGMIMGLGMIIYGYTSLKAGQGRVGLFKLSVALERSKDPTLFSGFFVGMQVLGLAILAISIYDFVRRMGGA